MSSPFNYEIDERDLREKLQNMQIPYREEAWNQFETYSDGCRASYKTTSLPKINFNINRSVILPVLFGAVIILFSMFLFNFVNIKNAQKKTEQKKTPAPEKTLAASLPVKKEPAIVQPAQTVPVKDTTKQSVVTPSVQAPAPVTITAVTPTVAAPPAATLAAKDSWVAIEPAQIYVHPDIKSQVIGSSTKNQSFTAIEETNYFIKVSFQKNGSTETGYIRKNIVYQPSASAMPGAMLKKKPLKKAEVMEPMQVPSLLPTGNGPEEKEPELK